MTTQRWLNAFSTAFVNAPAFNDPIAIDRNEGPGLKAPFMSHIGVRPKARICMSGEAIDTRTRSIRRGSGHGTSEGWFG